MKKYYIFLIALFLVNGAMAQWVPQNSGTLSSLNSVYFTDANTGYTVGRNGTILKTTNGGITWIGQDSGIADDLNSVYFTNTNTGYTVGAFGNILKTTNGGITWTGQNSGTNNTLNSVYFTDENFGYAVGTNGIILKTNNGGMNWNLKDAGTTVHFTSVDFPSVDTGFIAGCKWDTIKIFRTTNGGSTWVEQFSNACTNCWFQNLYELNFPDVNNGYACGVVMDYNNPFQILLKTTDGGLTWMWDNLGDLDYVLYSIFFTDTNIGYAVSGSPISYSKIYKTTDGGDNWTVQNSGTMNVLASVYFVDADTGIIVGFNGTILKTTNGGGYPVGINDRHQTAKTLTIYPNPTYTCFTIKTPTEGSIIIHNIAGQQLLQQEINELTTIIDVSTLPSGIYFVRLTGERTVKVGKFIKQ